MYFLKYRFHKHCADMTLKRFAERKKAKAALYQIITRHRYCPKKPKEFVWISPKAIAYNHELYYITKAGEENESY